MSLSLCLSVSLVLSGCLWFSLSRARSVFLCVVCLRARSKTREPPGPSWTSNLEDLRQRSQRTLEARHIRASMPQAAVSAARGRTPVSTSPDAARGAPTPAQYHRIASCSVLKTGRGGRRARAPRTDPGRAAAGIGNSYTCRRPAAAEAAARDTRARCYEHRSKDGVVKSWG